MATVKHWNLFKWFLLSLQQLQLLFFYWYFCTASVFLPQKKNKQKAKYAPDAFKIVKF